MDYKSGPWSLASTWCQETWAAGLSAHTHTPILLEQGGLGERAEGSSGRREAPVARFK